MRAGTVTSAQLVDRYLARIEAYDRKGPRINAIIAINPKAREEAAALDRERAARGPRGPLHGIPLVIKDNIDLAGLPTTAGSLAFAALFPAGDAFQVKKLREAGAVILAKTNLQELASGYVTVSSLGGQTKNPYDLTRNPGGSSGGTGAAVAANLAAAGLGTDTCGSIRTPASHNALVGLRTTMGLASRGGVFPMSHSQDIAGPLGADGRRRGDPARRNGGRRSRGSGHEARRGAGAEELSRRPEGGRVEGRAHRRAAQPVRDRARRQRGRHRGPARARRPEEAGGRGHRRRDSRLRRHHVRHEPDRRRVQGRHQRVSVARARTRRCGRWETPSMAVSSMPRSTRRLAAGTRSCRTPTRPNEWRRSGRPSGGS